MRILQNSGNDSQHSSEIEYANLPQNRMQNDVIGPLDLECDEVGHNLWDNIKDAFIVIRHKPLEHS